MHPATHVVITDSGLGGLSICAALEQGLRLAGPRQDIRLTYVNAWPYEDRGYNDLPDASARARVFDAALARITQMQPDRILVACNTLSILYPLTAFSSRPLVPVLGIVEAGVDLFARRLQEDPGSTIVLIGTRTTIESGVHRAQLEHRGVDPGRIAAVACHGLAAAIEREVDGPRTAELVGTCASGAARAAPSGGTLLVGLCCTHYGYVAVRIVDAVALRTGRRVRALDPNLCLVAGLLRDDAFLDGATRAGTPPATADQASSRGTVSVEVLSKVVLDEPARRGIARLVEPVSAATASALLSYAHVPDLF